MCGVNWVEGSAIARGKGVEHGQSYSKRCNSVSMNINSTLQQQVIVFCWQEKYCTSTSKSSSGKTIHTLLQ